VCLPKAPEDYPLFMVEDMDLNSDKVWLIRITMRFMVSLSIKKAPVSTGFKGRG
jgi:hypothetical protein